MDPMASDDSPSDLVRMFARTPEEVRIGDRGKVCENIKLRIGRSVLLEGHGTCGGGSWYMWRRVMVHVEEGHVEEGHVEEGHGTCGGGHCFGHLGL